MKFKAGYLGLCVVVLALIGSAVSGFVLNVDRVERTTTGYNYITDITGLFDFTDDPQYIEYDPASNYTGYTATVVNSVPTGISYELSTVANNYRIITSTGATVAGPSGTIDNNASYPLPSRWVDTYQVANVAIRPQSTGTHAAISSELTMTKAVTLYDWTVAAFGDLSQYDKIDVALTMPTAAYPVSYVFFNNVNSTLLQVSANQWTTITISASDLTFKAVTANDTEYSGSLYDFVMYYGASTQKTLMWSPNDSYYITDNTELTASWTSTVTYAPTYAYMIPDAGVTLEKNPLGGYFGTIWDNDSGTAYDNVVVNVLVKLDSAGRLTVSGMGAAFTVSMSEYGDFPAVMITWDVLRGVAEVRPVVDFINFNDYSVADTIIDTATITGQFIDNITFESVDNFVPLRWSVAGTTIKMDAQGVVMVNPSINLADYWPNMASYRFYIQSVALHGESVTINGVTYPIGDNESITINGVTERFRNVYVSYDLENNVSITFASNKRTVELGPAVDRTLSFDGAWYFNMGLYEGVSTTTSEYVWAGAFDSPDAIIILGLGLLLVLWVAVNRMGYSFKLLDKLVIAVAVFAMIFMIGGFL